jgi:hypothetical protein
VPNTAPINVLIAAHSPTPICAKIGPAQAPVIAQPIPNITPPMTVPLFNALEFITISFLSSVFT